MGDVANTVVLFDELSCAGSMRVGLATLNTPNTLNGLSLEMTRLLANQMEVWAQDPDVAMVLLRGAGDRAFCAGGDLHSLYRSMLENRGKTSIENTYAGTFFAEEYALDYRIHTFSKPILVWGDGIVMGGGMGLMMGASHRVVTETSTLAMPEISIGLFPDVGGTWLLNRLPGKTGLFMGLTGAHISASDALFSGMADYYVPRAAWEALLSGLQSIQWQHASRTMPSPTTRIMNDDALNTLLHRLSCAPQPEIGPLQQHVSFIQRLCSGSDLEKIVANLTALSTHQDPWLQRAAKTLVEGAPGSARLTYTLLDRCKHVSLAEAYRIEWTAGLVCASEGDFAEGIRARLVDKDKQPKWNPPTLQQATTEWVEKFFRPVVPANQHPLNHLGVTA